MMRVVCIVLIFCFSVSSFAKDKELRMGLDENMHPKFRQKEGKLAVDILADEVLSKWIKKINRTGSKIDNYLHTKDLIEDYKKNKIDVGLVGSRGFAEYKDIILSKSKEILSVRYDSERFIQLGFVVPKEKRNLPVSVWRNKRLALNEAPLVTDFLDLHLLKNYKIDSKKFFSSIRLIDSDGLAMMDLFFKKVDIIVVSKIGFDLSGELNPQIHKKFVFLPFADIADTSVLIFFNDSLEKANVDFLQSSVKEFLDTPRGEQIKNLLTINTITKTAKEDIDFMLKAYEKLEELREKY